MVSDIKNALQRRYAEQYGYLNCASGHFLVCQNLCKVFLTDFYKKCHHPPPISRTVSQLLPFGYFGAVCCVVE